MSQLIRVENLRVVACGERSEVEGLRRILSHAARGTATPPPAPRHNARGCKPRLLCRRAADASRLRKSRERGYGAGGVGGTGTFPENGACPSVVISGFHASPFTLKVNGCD